MLRDLGQGGITHGFLLLTIESKSGLVKQRTLFSLQALKKQALNLYSQELAMPIGALPRMNSP